MRKILKNIIDNIKPDKKPYSPGRMSTQEPKKQSRGRYRIIGPNGKIIYVGITEDLPRRKREHIRTGKLDPEKDKFAWSEAKKGVKVEKLREQEKKEIKKHKSPSNMNIGGGGRNPKKKGIRDFLKF